MDEQILETVRHIQRRNQGRVYPRHVAAWGVGYSERACRIHMVRLWREGQLVRLSARGGYVAVNSRAA